MRREMRAMNPEQPFILTLRLEPRLQGALDALRREHFPPERNFLAAHVTLFHALPGDREAALRQDLSEVAAATPPLGVTLPGVGHWGKGVFVKLESPGLLAARARLRAGWEPWLTRQDRQGYRPHVTVQNKVAKERAQALYEHLSATWHPLGGRALGLELWRYLGGPWAFVAAFDFATEAVTQEDVAREDIAKEDVARENAT